MNSVASPAHEVAVLWYTGYSGEEILSIDGDPKKAQGPCGGSLGGFHDPDAVCRVELLPAQYHMVVRRYELQKGQSYRGRQKTIVVTSIGSAHFEAKAGKFYTFEFHKPTGRTEFGTGEPEVELKIVDAADPDSRFGYD